MNNKPIIFILRGLPASGKSTWAHDYVARYFETCVRVNKDDLRMMLHNGVYSKARERLVLAMEETIILDAVRRGMNVIVDNTHGNPIHIQRITTLVGDTADIEVKEFFVPPEEAIKRDSERPNPVGEKVIMDMYEQWFKQPDPVPVFDPNLPTCVICDLDGTLCDLNGRNPYDASTCEQDLLVVPVARMLISLLRGPHPIDHIWFMSGREEKFRKQSEWFIHTNLPEIDGWWALVMRDTGDSTPDQHVKRGLYQQHIEGKYNVLCVFDDRPKVLREWRRLGLSTFAVGDEKEF